MVPSVIYAGFSGQGVHPMLGNPIFEGGKEFFSIRQGPKIWGNFSKICMHIIEKI